MFEMWCSVGHAGNTCDHGDKDSEIGRLQNRSQPELSNESLFLKIQCTILLVFMAHYQEKLKYIRQIFLKDK